VLERVRDADPGAVASIYAKAGLWYDALGAVSDEIERSPGNASARQARETLLGQVGLRELSAGGR
jgi:hypothetical protein